MADQSYISSALLNKQTVNALPKKKRHFKKWTKECSKKYSGKKVEVPEKRREEQGRSLSLLDALSVTVHDTLQKNCPKCPKARIKADKAT